MKLQFFYQFSFFAKKNYHVKQNLQDKLEFILHKSVIIMKKVNKSLIFIAFTLIIFPGCNNNPDQTTIEGTISNLEKSRIVISEMEPQQTIEIDSVKSDKYGHFKFTLLPDEKSFYNLTFPDRSMLTIISGRGDKIKISANANDIEGTYTVTGSEGSKQLREYFKHTIKNERKVDSLNYIFEKNKNSPDFHIIRGLLEQSFTKIFIDQQEFTREFVKQNPGSLASLVALNYRFVNNRVLDIEADIELFELVDMSLARKYQDNKHFQHHHKTLMEMHEFIAQRELAERHTSIGRTIPSFEMKDINGNSIRIEEFRGKPLLIYFWAAWDAKSRQTNRRLNALLDSFYPLEVPVLAISFDNNPEIWKAAIKIDSLEWNHASDLLGMNSPVITFLNIPDKLPYFYLLNAEGEIIFKGKDLDIVSEKISLLRTLN